jgi:predicted nucleic acid-binding protein
MVLVDTNVWISAFKDPKSAAATPLAQLLLDKHACFTAIIRAELLSGARHETEYQFLETRLAAIPLLEEKPGLWDAAAHARFKLARQGVQEGLLDLSIACMAVQHHARLWTSDKQFAAIQKVVPFKRFDPS